MKKQQTKLSLSKKVISTFTMNSVTGAAGPSNSNCTSYCAACGPRPSGRPWCNDK